MKKAKLAQKDVVLNILLSKRRLSSYEAVTELRIMRLASVISKLKKDGWPIDREKIAGTSAVKYFLPDDEAE